MAPTGTDPPRPLGELAALRRTERAAALLGAHRPRLLRAARRFSSSSEDAEDAVQRASEILFRKGPDAGERELLAWMRVVVRREALALRRRRGRAAPDPACPDGWDPDLAASTVPEPGDALEARERVAAVARDLAALKPQERRAIALQAAGCSYAEIQAITGWTYTKVNRCLAEGRARLRAMPPGAGA